MPFIVSKMAAGVDYTTYTKGTNGLLTATGAVSVNGGAGVANKRTLVTLEGAVTEVTQAQLAQLENDPVFSAHKAGGYLKVLKTMPKSADAAAADLAKDKSAQVTPADYTEQGKKAPKTGKAEA